jgi:RNA polymerase sigma factor (sigma-70 family)
MAREELESVVQQAKTGNSEAFGLLVRRFQDMAVGYAFSILHDFHLAEDAAQEAFIQAHQDLWQLRNPHAFPAWLRRLIFKQCDRQTRKGQLETVPLELAAAVPSDEIDPFQAVETQESYYRVQDAIRCLADHERTVVTLFYISQYSHKEISTFLDIPVSTVKKRLHDARRHLKERMVVMVHDSLHNNRPSRDERFVQQFCTGGTLPRDAPSYVVRRADTDLYEGLTNGRLCCVLTTRQMGKSSLMLRTTVRLRELGIAVAFLDLTAVGYRQSLEDWLHALLERLAQQFDSDSELEVFWQSHPHQAPARRWGAALRDVVLPRLAERRPLKVDGPAKVAPHPSALPAQPERRLVICIDEIDYVRSLPFSVDPLFAEIRACCGRASTGVALQGLSFCLLGVASPADLGGEEAAALWNTAQQIVLRDFTLEEVQSLAPMLARPRVDARRLLRRVLYWTGGHPYLTQVLCRAISDDETVIGSACVDRLCESLFFCTDPQDDNLVFVRDRLLCDQTSRGNPREMYANLLNGEPIPIHDGDPRCQALLMAGIARAEDGHLRIRNRIYERVFDQGWVDSHRLSRHSRSRFCS